MASGASLVSTLVNFIKGISEHYVVKIDGETIDSEQTMICICNGRYYGGGFNPIPDADPADGYLDVLLVRKIHRAEIPPVIGKYKNGRYKELQSFARYFRTRELEIVCDKPTVINLDGEARTSTDMHISLADEKIRFFYPKGLTWKAEEKARVQ